MLFPAALLLAMQEPKLPPMQELTLLIFRSGTRPQGITQEALEEMQSKHIANLQRLGAEKKGAAAGPFENGGEMRGIVVLTLPKEKVAVEFEADPYVKNGIMKMSLYKWMVPKDMFTWKEFEKMMPYTFAWVTPGPNANRNDAELQADFNKHINLNLRLMRAGSASLIGPLTEENEFARGVYIFPTEDPAEAATLVAGDPLIKSGYFAWHTQKLWMQADLFKKLSE